VKSKTIIIAAVVFLLVLGLFSLNSLVQTYLIGRSEAHIIQAALSTLPEVIQEFGRLSSLSLDGGEATIPFPHQSSNRGVYRFSVKGISESGRIRVAWERPAQSDRIIIEVFRTFSDKPPQRLYSGGIPASSEQPNGGTAEGVAPEWH
jgi:hypothetical protein